VNKKEAKKTLLNWTVLVKSPWPRLTKVFWLLFFKKVTAWLRLNLPSSSNMRLWLAALAALTVLRLILAATIPLAPDEAYYALWAHHLQAGYFDHPPMVALWIAAGTTIAGNDPLGIRLLGPISGALGTMLIWRAGEDFFPHRQAGLMAAALLNATLLVGVGAIIMTPDTPLLFFWTAAIAALGRLIATRNQGWWLALGVAAGAALLSKYTGLLLVAAVGIWLLTSVEGRASLRTRWPWAGLVLALVIFAPNIWWNWSHGWVSYLKQGGRETQFDAGRAAQYLAELLGSQIGLATPIIFGLGVAGLWRLGRMPGAAAHLLVWLAVVPGVVFLEHVISGRVQANWPAVLYPAGCLAAAGLPMATLRRWLRPAVALGFLLNIVVYAQVLAAPFPLTARADPTALQLAGWGAVTAQVQAQAAAAGASFITSDEYATAAEFAAHTNGGIPVLGFEPRWFYFGYPPSPPGGTGVIVSRRADMPCPEPLGTALRKRGNDVIATFKICRVTGPANGVILP
jgi:4-amino-4-deoxy-L-arabinose transferase-like glycosyltransferase